MSDQVFEGFLNEQLSKGLALGAQSDLVKLTPCGDRLGAPDRYLAELSCKGLVREADRVVEHEDFLVGVYFAPDYLRRVDAGELFTWLRPASVWHPNIAPPFVCPGFITPGMELADLIWQLYEMITYHNYRCDDCLNPAAAQWARGTDRTFPVDRRPLVRVRRLELRVTDRLPSTSERPQ